MILKCNSAKCMAGHQQDKLHGAGKRVMNPTKDPEAFRCTVCSEVTRTEKKGGTPTAPAKKAA